MIGNCPEGSKENENYQQQPHHRQQPRHGQPQPAAKPAPQYQGGFQTICPRPLAPKHDAAAASKPRRLSLIGSLPEKFLGNVVVTMVDSGSTVYSQTPRMITAVEVNPAATPPSKAAPESTVSPHPSSDVGPLDQYTGCRFDTCKPPFSYATLITQAIQAAPDRRLTLAMIYQSIKERHPYYRGKNCGWQNSIRHNLSLNKCFQRIERVGEKGKGAWWTIGREAFLEHQQVPVLKCSRDRKRRPAGAPVQEEAAHQPAVAEAPALNEAEAVVNRLSNDYSSASLFWESVSDTSAATDLSSLCASLTSIYSRVL